MTRTWLMGRGADCDVILERPSIAVHHCRLTYEPGGEVVLQDLGSTEGTFVNGVRIWAPARVTPGDAVTLGPHVPLPWPEGAVPQGWKILTIGREPDNDFVFDLASVSSYHARVLGNMATGPAIIEDLGSANGTVLASTGSKISRAALVSTDTVFFGSHPIPASFLLARMTTSPGDAPRLTFRGSEMTVGRDPSCDQCVDVPIVSTRHARLTRAGAAIWIEDLGSSNGTFVNGRRVDRPVVVAPGDQIQLGNYSLTLVVPDASADLAFTPARGVSVPTVPLRASPAGFEEGFRSAPLQTAAGPPESGSHPVPWLGVVLSVMLLLVVVLLIGIGALLAHRQNVPASDRLARAPATAPDQAAVADATQVAPVNPEESPRRPPGPLREPVSMPMPSVPIARSVPLPGYDVASTTPAKPPAAVAPATAPNAEAQTDEADLARAAQKPLSDQLPESVLAWANSLDLAHLSPQDEGRLGACLHQIVLSHLKPVEDGPLVERALDAARRVGGSDLTVTILDSDVVSGFSLPGGHVYLCRGLIEFIGSDEDYALDFVIGHEVAHLKLKHGLKTVAANVVEARRRGIDTFNQFLVPIALGYRNALEFEADSWIYRWMITQPDYSKRMCLAFLRKFRDYADRQKFASGGKEPDREFPLFENHFRAHPAARDRLRRLESFSAEPATTVVK